MATNLKSCPFCGSSNVAQGASRDRISVWCFCGARGPDVAFPEHCDPVPPIHECYERWNRRPAHDELVAALKGLLAANDAVENALCEGPDVPGYDPLALGMAQRRVTEAEAIARAALSRTEGEQTP